jgi:hypothetical protein
MPRASNVQNQTSPAMTTEQLTKEFEQCGVQLKSYILRITYLPNRKTDSLLCMLFLKNIYVLIPSNIFSNS